MCSRKKFPELISFTVTNRCNLRCCMCGQWSENGYIKNRKTDFNELSLAEWIALSNQLSAQKVSWLLIRGGEPFLMPGIMDLLRHINQKGINLSIDTNGTLLEKYAHELIELDKLHITISLDGPPEIHDRVRGVPGTYARLSRGIEAIHHQEKITGKHIEIGLSCVINNLSYSGLERLPATARELGVDSITIVPVYYYPEAVGKEYSAIMEKEFGCRAYSWKGFHAEDSGVPPAAFLTHWQGYLAELGELTDYHYLPLTAEEYTTWFRDAVTPVRIKGCRNIDRLLDIQPDGRANFCVDLPDFSPGNAAERSIEEIWNSPEAEQFRAYRRRKPLPVCHRCGAKYIAEMDGEQN